MKRILTLTLAAAVLLGAGFYGGVRWEPTSAKGEQAPAAGTHALQPEYRSGPFRIGVEVTPGTPKVGSNRLRVLVQDADGNPVRGAQIKAVATMPAMGAMPAMHAPAEMAEGQAGVYAGGFELPMKGSWPLTLDIQAPGLGSTRLTLDMATGRAGLQLSSGGTQLAAAGDRAEGAAGGGSGTLPYRSGPYRFDIELAPKRPRVGGNTLTLRLQGPDGQPLTSAAPQAVAEMPAMGSMPAMRAPAELKHSGAGVYRGRFDLPMEGSWPLTLRLNTPGLPERKVSFDMATGRAGLSVASGAVRQGSGMPAMEEAPPGTVTLDAARRQLIGVRTAKARVADLTRTIRAVGQVTYDETRLADVSLKFDAWVGKLYVDYVGAAVHKGQPLFTIYGPKLLAAQQEYLELLRRERHTAAAKTLIAAARKRLQLWDMTPREIAALEKRGSPLDYVPIHAPIDGTVVEKNVVEGTAHPAGKTLMRIADLSQVWIDADVYEAELPLLRPGMRVEVRLPYLPNHLFKGSVAYVYPYLDPKSRTGRIRITLPNPDGVLKPNMYAEAKLKADLGKRLTVPEEAVIVSGDTRVVFEDLGGGRLAPRVVQTGQRADGRIEIVDGLRPGATVVTSGNFLIASESRLKAGLNQW